jgi:hypothetical protein
VVVAVVRHLAAGVAAAHLAAAVRRLAGEEVP